uniref:Uncharacterized protein n=1 Tax=Hyaloperonospora arabidopsidis (strain Emoy2) TaxID=559515 RepID=M4BQ65_HYAAE
MHHRGPNPDVSGSCSDGSFSYPCPVDPLIRLDQHSCLHGSSGTIITNLETVIVSKSIPRNYGEFLPMIRRTG